MKVPNSQSTCCLVWFHGLCSSSLRQAHSKRGYNSVSRVYFRCPCPAQRITSNPRRIRRNRNPYSIISTGREHDRSECTSIFVYWSLDLLYVDTDTWAQLGIVYSEPFLWFTLWYSQYLASIGKAMMQWKLIWGKQLWSNRHTGQEFERRDCGMPGKISLSVAGIPAEKIILE
jgi:hypothetical protein